MVLDIPGGLFGQSDVRETATAITAETSSSQSVSFSHANIGSDWEDVTGASIIVSGLTAGQKVLIMESHIGGPDSAGEIVYSRLVRNSTTLGNIRGVYVVNGTGWFGTSHQWIDTPGAGNFEYKIQGKSSDGYGDFEVGDMTVVIFN